MLPTRKTLETGIDILAEQLYEAELRIQEAYINAGDDPLQITMKMKIKETKNGQGFTVDADIAFVLEKYKASGSAIILEETPLEALAKRGMEVKFVGFEKVEANDARPSNELFEAV
jgi:hypothetical protein